MNEPFLNTSIKKLRGLWLRVEGDYYLNSTLLEQLLSQFEQAEPSLFLRVKLL